MGLKPRHHGELNKLNVPQARYDELRQEYAGDPVAQQQIDVYDPATEYHVHFARFRDAVRDGNTAIELSEMAWLTEHYPDLT